MSEVYKERVGRYRIMRHYELPESYKAEYRAAGIDPDNEWSLIWSFNDEAHAIQKLGELSAHSRLTTTYKLVDGGEEIVIERSSWF